MPQYRLFFIDPFGQFQDVEIIDGADDEQAVAKARQHVNGEEMELWHRDRFIGRIGRDGRLA